MLFLATVVKKEVELEGKCITAERSQKPNSCCHSNCIYEYIHEIGTEWFLKLNEALICYLSLKL